MAKELHVLPHVSTQGGISGTDLMLVKKTVLGVPLDFKVDYNTLFSGMLRESDVGTGVGNLFRLVDSGGNAALPAISGALLTNINVPTASASTEGAVTLSDAINGTQGVTQGFAATPKSVGDLNNLAFKKAGGELSGAITLPNNVAVKLKTNSSTPMDVLILDASNDLLIGKTSLSPADIKMTYNDLLELRSNAGNVIYSFHTNGTSTGIKALDVTAAAKTGISAGTVDSQLGTLATTKLNSTGGTATGTITFTNDTALRGNLFASGDVSLINVDTSDVIHVGSIGAAKTRLHGGAGGIELYTGGAVRLAVSNTGVLSGVKSADITYPTGTGGITATNVQTALSWLGANTLGVNGGDINATINMANNASYAGKDTGGASRSLAYMNTSDQMVFGTGGFTNIQRSDNFLWTNNTASIRLSMTNTGYLSGVSLHSSTMNHTASGGVTEGFVGTAIQGLDTRKFDKSGGTLTGTTTINNNLAFSCKETGGTVRPALWIDSSNRMRVGSGSTATRFQGNSMDWLNASSVVHMSLSNAGVLSGTALQASTMNFSPANGLTAVTVQAAIDEVYAAALTGGAAEFNGAINFANNVGVTSRNAADSANLNVIKLTGSNALQVGDGSVTAINLQSAGSVNFVNGSGSTIFGINAQAGTLTGFNSNLIGNTPAGGIQATNVQVALNELDTEKLAKTGGTITGSLVVTGNITGTSDINKKKNIKSIKGALAKVRRIGGQTYDRTDMDMPRQMGVIAQIVEQEFPECVATDKDGSKSVAYGNLSAGGGFAAIDELAIIVEEQNEEISTLSIALDTQADQISELREMVKSLLET